MNNYRTRSRTLRVLVALFVMSSCRAADAPRSERTPPHSSASPRDSALFAALLDSVPAEEKPLLAVRTFLTDNGWIASDSIMRWVAKGLDIARPETITAFRVAITDGGRADSLFGIHSGVMWVSHDSGSTSPPPAAVLHVSRPGYSADSSQAMLYAVYRCGAHCGRVDYVLLERTSPALEWRVRARLRRDSQRLMIPPEIP